MLIEPEKLHIRDMYQHLIRIVTPRPIAWVSTVSDEGVHNLAPYSFFNGVTANPPSVVFSPVNRRDGSKKDTVINIEQNRQFVVNIVNRELAEVMNQTSAEYDSEVDEFEITGIAYEASSKVAPRRVKESPIQLECELIQIVPVGEGPLASNLVIGKILLAHVSDSVLDSDGQIDPQKVDSVGRMGGIAYSTTRDRFELDRPTT